MNPDITACSDVVSPSFGLLLWVLPSANLVWAIVAILLLMVCSASLSASEVAFFGLSHSDLDTLDDEEDPTAQRIQKLTDTPKQLLATILISNNFVNIGVVTVSDFITRSLLPDEVFLGAATWLHQFFDASIPTLERSIGFAINVVGVSSLLVLFGEVTPKIYAQLNKVPFARRMSIPLSMLSVICAPLSYFLVNTTSFLEKRLANNAQGNSSNLTTDDLDEAIELTVRDLSVNNEGEIDILKRIVRFNEVAVKQVMRPRIDVVSVDFRTPFPELLRTVRTSGFSRIPIHEEDFDHIVGILYAKDLIDHLFEPPDFEWQQLIRINLIYTPESKRINDLLKDFQTQHLHMAIVVDEYGGSAGIVTLEDIMEEVIGEIRDEFDDEIEVEYQQLDEHNFVFEGKTLLNDVCRAVGIDTETFEDVKGESDSLAGLVLEIKGFFPTLEEEIKFEGYTFKVITMNTRRIERVQLTLPKTDAAVQKN